LGVEKRIEGLGKEKKGPVFPEPLSKTPSWKE